MFKHSAVFPIEGRAAIEEMWRWLVGRSPSELTLKLETLELNGDGDHACEVGRYKRTNRDGKVIDSGKYIAIWRHGEDGWKVHRDLFNADPAPAPPPAQPAGSAVAPGR